jgi:hypothetical protein
MSGNHSRLQEGTKFPQEEEPINFAANHIPSINPGKTLRPNE